MLRDGAVSPEQYYDAHLAQQRERDEEDIFMMSLIEGICTGKHNREDVDTSSKVRSNWSKEEIVHKSRYVVDLYR